MSIQCDMEIMLKVFEVKVKLIDQFYKEVVVENELLYECFNGELGKIVKVLKGKGKEDKEELMIKLKEQGDEVVRMKKDNVRLKREMVSLKVVLKVME